MKMTLNREFLRRHLFAVVLLAGMGLWFGYDGFVRYPKLTPAELYADAHKGEAASSDEVAQKFYATAIPRQKQFMALCLLAALAVGAHLFAVSRLEFSFDDSGFTYRGKRYFWNEIRHVNRRKWAKKGIIVVKLSDGTVTLDAWHHVGVREFEKKLTA